MQADTSIMG